MAKDWVKVHVSMLFHEQTQTLPAEAFRAWVNMLLYAGLIDDGGRLGPAPSVAYALHIDPGDMGGILAVLNGRIVERDGELHIRDWAEWQAKSPAERKADQRSREARTVPDCHDASRDVTTGHAESRLSHISDQSDQGRTEAEEEQNTTAAPVGAALPVSGNGHVAPDRQPSAERWAPFYDDCGELWHTSPYRKDGAALAWAGQLAHHFGRFAGDDVTAARRLLRQWSRSPDFRFALSPSAAPPKAGKWLTENATVDVAVLR